MALEKRPEHTRQFTLGLGMEMDVLEEDDGPPRDVAAAEIAGLGDLRCMPGVEPGAFEDALVL